MKCPEQYRHDRAWNRSASFRLTQLLKIIPHMIRSYYHCCCINEPVIFSQCVHLKLLWLWRYCAFNPNSLDNKGSCWILLDFYCSVTMLRELRDTIPMTTIQWHYTNDNRNWTTGNHLLSLIVPTFIFLLLGALFCSRLLLQIMSGDGKMHRCKVDGFRLFLPFSRWKFTLWEKFKITLKENLWNIKGL